MKYGMIKNAEMHVICLFSLDSKNMLRKRLVIRLLATEKLWRIQVSRLRKRLVIRLLATQNEFYFYIHRLRKRLVIRMLATRTTQCLSWH